MAPSPQNAENVEKKIASSSYRRRGRVQRAALLKSRAPVQLQKLQEPPPGVKGVEGQTSRRAGRPPG